MTATRAFGFLSSGFAGVARPGLGIDIPTPSDHNHILGD
jgi:hypothetical protein